MSENPPEAISTRTVHSAWIAPTLTALLIGMVFVAVYVGLQRAPEPDSIPVAVVGSSLQHQVAAGLGDRVDVTEVDSVGAGRRLVQDGTTVGVLAVDAAGTVQLDYASAAGLSESGAVRAMTQGFAKAAHLKVRESDTVPLVRYDSLGLVSFYVIFGVTLSSFILAQALSGNAARVRLRHRLLIMVGFAVLIGIAAAVIAGPVYGAVKVPFPALAGVLVLLSAASAFGTKALVTWLGSAGVGIAVLLLTVAGNATSGASIGFNLLPKWAQLLSDVLPQGAAVRALQSAGYFDGSAVWQSVAVLACWAVIGFGLVVAHGERTARNRRRSDRSGHPAHLAAIARRTAAPAWVR
ncbi:ABC transporter permease [Agreia sp. COWG]|uniref:ABC transporter permease n=1 Tax=Agreia sp. COWG TaxID=2773266 RepID=UPI0019273E44|nr:ABC transporter permease [Agreia sp. COWG]CAD5989668.1 ABC transporter permease [Agreia sp. COWG]